MPDSESALAAFESAGAFLRGHFVYTSGRHGADYLEKFRILEDPAATMTLAATIAEHFRSPAPELVAGPTTGGIILAFEVARQLGVNAVYVERGHDGGRVLRRGFTIRPGATVLVVDDGWLTGPNYGLPARCRRQGHRHWRSCRPDLRSCRRRCAVLCLPYPRLSLLLPGRMPAVRPRHTARSPTGECNASRESLARYCNQDGADDGVRCSCSRISRR